LSGDLRLSALPTKSRPESGSGALIRTRIVEKQFLADQPAPHFNGALRSETPK